MTGPSPAKSDEIWNAELDMLQHRIQHVEQEQAKERGLLAPLVAPTALQKLGVRLIFSSFRQARRGRCRVILPNGAEETFGDTTEQASMQAELRVLDWSFFSDILLHGHIGAGEAYMRGYWISPDVSKVLAWVLLNQEAIGFLEGSPAKTWLFNSLGLLDRLKHWLRPNSLSGSQQNIQEHYDLGNAFFRLFLDEKTLAYSSGYYQHPEEDLAGAQVAKFERLCRMLRLQADFHVLEIGSGWGGMAFHMAERYGCDVTTVTLSHQQAQYVREEAERRGLSGKVTVLLEDYRKLKGKYDRIVSIEMIEAVGDAYYETFFRQCNQLLKPDGLLAIQMITCPDARYELVKNSVDFIQKHIFPGSLLPSLGRLHEASSKAGELFLHDLKDMTPSYARTLAEWAKRVEAKHDDILELGYSSTFYRKWCYYLAYCQAAFQMRHINVVQALYSRSNNLTLMDADLRLA